MRMEGSNRTSTGAVAELVIEAVVMPVIEAVFMPAIIEAVFMPAVIEAVALPAVTGAERAGLGGVFGVGFDTRGPLVSLGWSSLVRLGGLG